MCSIAQRELIAHWGTLRALRTNNATIGADVEATRVTLEWISLLATHSGNRGNLEADFGTTIGLPPTTVGTVQALRRCAQCAQGSPMRNQSALRNFKLYRLKLYLNPTSFSRGELARLCR